MRIRDYGFEREFFLANKEGVFVYLPKDTRVPHDNCGYLAEARGRPSESPWYASRLYDKACCELDWVARKEGLRLVASNEERLAQSLLVPCRVYHQKHESQAQFLNRQARCQSEVCQLAGLHVHFGIHWWGRKKHIVEIVSYMDRAFSTEIALANRVAGEYELKPYGFEYRSLPACTPIKRVVDHLERFRDGERVYDIPKPTAICGTISASDPIFAHPLPLP